MSFPTPEAQAILRELIAHIATGTVIPSNPETFAGYKEVHDALNLTKRADTYGNSLKLQGLQALAEWARDEQHPAVTGLVVNKTRESPDYLQPGYGYFEVNGRNLDFRWWESEVERSLTYPWERFLRAPEPSPPPPPPAPPETPEASDLGQPPERVLTQTYRVLRDTELARQVKSWHNYECQICGLTIELPDGSRYAEAHHIQPLGKPHDGSDQAGNILCVCPNHHVQLDYGVIPLALSELHQSPAHQVDQKNVDYHNQIIHKARLG